MFWHHESKYADPGGLEVYGVGLRPLACWTAFTNPAGGINKGCVFCYSYRAVSYIQYTNQQKHQIKYYKTQIIKYNSR